MDDINNPDEVISDDNDGETLEELNAKIATLTENNSNLNKALKSERGKTKTPPAKGKSNVDFNEVVDRKFKEQALIAKYNGEGMPKFDIKELKEYAEEKGFNFNKVDPESIYKLKHSEVLTDVLTKQALKRNQGVITADGKRVADKDVRTNLAGATTTAEINKAMGL